MPTPSSSLRSRRSCARLWPILLAAATCACSLMVASFSVETARASPPGASYHDAVAESESGPDIETVEITQPTPTEISLAISFVNRRSLASKELVAVDFDTDLEADTGDDEGFDFGIEVFGGETTLWRWRQQTRDWGLVESATVESRWEFTTLNIVVAPVILGSPETFRFSILADANPKDESAPLDLAPNYGHWRYPPADLRSMNWLLFALLMSVVAVGTISALFIPGAIDALRNPGWRRLTSPLLWPFAVFVVVAFGMTFSDLWSGMYEADQTEGEVFRSYLMDGAVLGALTTGIVLALLGVQYLRRRSGASSLGALRMVVGRSLERKIDWRRSKR